jgi:hypothetical protein
MVEEPGCRERPPAQYCGERVAMLQLRNRLSAVQVSG